MEHEYTGAPFETMIDYTLILFFGIVVHSPLPFRTESHQKQTKAAMLSQFLTNVHLKNINSEL